MSNIAFYRTIRLHGALGQQFGREHHVDADTPGQVIYWLCSQFKGFAEVFRPGKFAILRGGKEIDQAEEIGIRFGSCMDMDVVPEFCGDKSFLAIGKFILGAALLTTAIVLSGGAFSGAAIGFYTSTGFIGATYGGLALAGAALMLSGIYQMVSPVAKVGDAQNRETPAQRASFLLNQIVNTSEEGSPVPVAVGRRIRIGSKVVSAGIMVAQTPLTELLDSEVNATAESVLKAIRSFLSVATFNGLARVFLKVGDDEYSASDYSISEGLGPYGYLNPLVYRNKQVWMLGEQRDIASNMYRFHVVVDGSQPRDFFQTVKVTSADGATTYLDKASSTSDAFVVENRTSFVKKAARIGNGFYYQSVRITRWTWDIGVGAGFQVPATTNDASNRRVVFGYST